MSSLTSPPKLPLRLFRWFCHPDYVEDIEGDLRERFENRKKEGRAVKMWFMLEVLKLIRPGIIRSFQPFRNMQFFRNFNHYSRISFRLFAVNKLVTAFSLTCLIVGAVSSVLMYRWVRNEVSMDEFHKNKDNIHFLMMKPEPMAKPEFMMNFLGPELEKEYPEVLKELDVQVYDSDNEAQISVGEKANSINLWVTGKEFFEVFDFPFLHGDSSDILNDPMNMVISKQLSQKLFGDEYPIGKKVTLYCQEVGSYEITGVLDDYPANSSLQFDALVPNHNSDIRWSRSGSKLILVDENFDGDSFNKKIADIAQSHHQFKKSEVFSIPFNEFYFGQRFHNSLFAKFGDSKVVRNMVLIAVVILLICLFGFTNLQHIQQLNGNKSLAVRCINGASRMDLFHEVLVGRFYLAMISTVIASVLIVLTLPAFNHLVNVPLTLAFGYTILITILVVFVIVSFSLLFSLFHIYRFQLIDAFRKTLFLGSIPFLQRSVTVLQYAITITLLIASLIAYLQYDHMMNKDLGIDAANVIEVQIANEMLMDKSKSRELLMEEYEAMQKSFHFVTDELKRHSSILQVSQSSKPIEGVAYPMEIKIKGSEQDFRTHNIMTVDPDYADLFDLTLIEGRFFNQERDKSRGKQVVINESAQKYWGLESLSGIKIENKYWGEFEIIGIVKDFNYESVASNIEPLVMYYMTDIEDPFLIKMQKGREDDALQFIEAQHAMLSPGRWFGYTFLEDELQAQYDKEKQAFQVYGVFTSIAVLLSFMNLFAFAWSETRRRIKEMGIRKVHGARPEQLFVLLGLSFWKLVLIAFVMASPVVWLVMDNWLADYSYRINLEWWNFLAGGFIAFFISFLAVSGQSWLVAKTNPADVLRYE